MSSEDTYQAVDAVVSSNFSIYSPSVSRPRGSVQPYPGSASRTRLGQSAGLSEQDALLGGGKPAKKPFYRPRPLWLVPFAVVASIVRGMTLAPRVQVYTQLSCNAVYGHDVYDHTRVNETSLFPNSHHIPSLPSHSAASVPLELHFPASQQSVYANLNGTKPSDDDDEPDPRRPPSERCIKDPAVQSRAARLQTIMTTTMGVLSALTTGWWGHFGETNGRTRVLAVATFGLFMTDLVFILVSTPHSIFAAHGHKLLIISPIIEGLCGGWSTLQAATSAYISDCTSDGSRAHIFSRFTGMFFLGFAVGPTIGAFLIKHPFIPVFSPAIGVHNGAPTVTSVFYVGATASFINLMLVIFLFPESLHKKRAKMAAQSLLPAISTPSAEGEAVQGIVHRFISPLKLFLPKTVHGPNGTKHTDWSMTLLATVLFGYLLSNGIFQIKYLYAEHVYGWGAEQLSYYISAMGFARALHLLLVLPFIISTFKPKPKPKPAQPGAQVANTGKPNAAALAKEMRFDMALIRGSLLIDLFSHSIVALSSPEAGPAAGQALFVGATAMNSFGAGLIPAVNSLALCILQSRGVTDTGKMFGAFSVLQATGQMIVGPILFGIIYSNTVATFPKTIFAFAGSLVFVSLVVFILLRPDAMLKPHGKGKRVGAGPATLEAHLDIPRGRSRKSKDIRQSFSGMQIPPYAGQSYGATSSSSGSGSASGFGSAS
ncbi:MFS general substrate transporter [Lentinus tigrinus ALCF2SS1-7]|uniref:MFS general substrate transporter n=1 Tax=Lentinus tigrinus ALCF2SS1-6 TaxID=1328759 RepID=A0A5C2RVR3_9APHY|nr:MFS general substrate transporter [Lentinus tigrinus ALCF2SS1-6]RPD69280.1 MFS general substrate transporter [Lentinus tigrinus ALCF2SS1-7]